MPANYAQFTNLGFAGTEFCTMFTGHLDYMWFEHITSNELLIDTLVSQRNATSTVVTDTIRQINNDSGERSPLEEVALHIVLNPIVNELPVELFVYHMRLLSPYHAHCDLVERMLSSEYN